MYTFLELSRVSKVPNFIVDCEGSGIAKDGRGSVLRQPTSSEFKQRTWIRFRTWRIQNLRLWFFQFQKRRPPRLRHFWKLADKVAAGGYYVVVPDFFNGDPFNPENKERSMQVWLQSHGTDKGFEDAKLIIAALKDKGISAIGAAGFCWGAKVVVQLAKSDNIQAAVLLHPSFVSADDIKEVKAPIAILGAEIDKQSPPELLKQFEEILSSKPEVDSFVKIYPGVAHGWTVRYNVEDKKAVQSAEEAHQDMLDWFNKHIK